MSTPAEHRGDAAASPWRVTYQPGEWTLLAGPSAVVVLEPAPARASAVITRIWELVLEASGPDDLVTRLAGVGLNAMPNLAVVFRDDEGLHALLRGRIALADAGGAELCTGAGARTWRECDLGVDSVDVRLPGVERSDDLATLPLLVGAARVGWVHVDATTGAVPAIADAWQGAADDTSTGAADATAAGDSDEDEGHGALGRAAAVASAAGAAVIGGAAAIGGAVAGAFAGAATGSSVGGAAGTAAGVGDTVAGVASGVASDAVVTSAEPIAGSLDVTANPAADLAGEGAADDQDNHDHIADDLTAAGHGDPGNAGTSGEAPAWQAPAVDAGGGFVTEPSADAPADPDAAGVAEHGADADHPAGLDPATDDRATDDSATDDSATDDSATDDGVGEQHPSAGSPDPRSPSDQDASQGTPDEPAVTWQPTGAPSGRVSFDAFRGDAASAPGQAQPGSQPAPDSGDPEPGSSEPEQDSSSGVTDITPEPADQGSEELPPWLRTPAGAQAQPAPAEEPPNPYGSGTWNERSAAYGADASWTPVPPPPAAPLGQSGDNPWDGSASNSAGDSPDSLWGDHPVPPGDEAYARPASQPVSEPLFEVLPDEPAAGPANPAGGVEHDGDTLFQSAIAATHRHTASADEPPAGAQVMADLCPSGHANRPGVRVCRVCGASMGPSHPQAVARPVLGELRTSAGERTPVTGPVLIGRAPSAQRYDPASTLLRVPSPSQDISRTHLLVDQDGWGLTITDLHSTNGTIVTPPGAQTRRLNPGETVALEIGTLIDLGDGVTIDVAPYVG